MLPFNHNDNCTGSVCFCDDYNKQIEHLHNNSITEEIKRLKAENARYREALEFYAHQNSWTDSLYNYTTIKEIQDDDLYQDEDEHGQFLIGGRRSSAISR